MKKFVISMLTEKLAPYHYYHNIEHTLYVYENVKKIAKHEHCTEEEIGLLKAAALWHDTGFIHHQKGHEEESCVLAKTYLPQFGFQEHEITDVCGMIMATKIPQNPKTKLEEIIADADLEYLGTEHAEKIALRLYRELKNSNPNLDITQWNEMQIAFLSAHHYFTDYCKKHNSKNKQAYLDELKQRSLF